MISTPPRSLIVALLLLGLLSFVLHGVFLLHLASVSAEAGVSYFSGPDTPAYLRAADALRGEAGVNPMYHERILLPLIIVAVQAMGLEAPAALWVILLLEIPATLAMGYLGWALSGRRSVAGLAAMLYVLHPDTYQNGALLQTDLMHVQWALIAAAATVHFVRERNARLALWAALPWILAQLTRPTYFMIAAGFLIPLWAWRKDAALRRGFIWLSLLSLVVPAGWSIGNAIRFGVPSPSLCMAEMLETWTVPRAKALLRNAQQPVSLTVAFDEEVARVRATDTWQVLHGHKGAPEDFRHAYRGSISSNAAFLATNVAVTLSACRAELRNEIMFVPKFHHPDASSALNGRYPDVSRWLGMAYKVGFLFLAFAAPLAFRREYWPLFFLFGAMVALVLGPASLSWWCCGRYRFNVNILLLPIVALGLARPAAWCVVGATFVFGYLPVHLLHAAPMLVAVVATMALGMAWTLLALTARRGSHG